MDLNRPALNRASSRLRAGGGNLSSYAYAVNALGQRQTVTTGGTAMAAPATTRWGYDGLGQLVAEDFANNQAANPRDRGYAYDLIGNRENSIQGNTNPLAAGNLSYDANPLNQYTSIGAFQPVHDDDGNLTTGRLHSAALGNVGGTPYTGTLHWNGENRLAKVEDGSAVKATYQYDFMGRRVRKQVGSTVTWYVYDGYNELGRFTQTGTGAPAIQRTFTWGLDISNTPQGAGGVGGLLSVKVHGTASATYFPTYDANGNISEYLASNGSVAAHFEYDGFGNTVVNTDTNGLFDYRFSTKPLEDVTGFYYYLYRYYDAVTGRWPARDPIEERGGMNLYGFVGNNGVNRTDLLGLSGTDGALCLQDELSQEPYSILADKVRTDGCTLNVFCICNRERAGEGVTNYRERDKTVNIEIYYYPPGSKPDLGTLLHELVHARDYCEGWLKRGDCRSNMCSELKAYKVTPSPINVDALSPEIYRDMLINQAANSVGSNCSSREEAIRIGNEIFDECVGQGNVF